MPLLRTRRFLPLFITQFLGAFNDNLFKNALVMGLAFTMAGKGGMAEDHSAIFVTVAAGLFILPFFLFSATAGQLADKLDRARIARAVKVAEIIIMLVAAYGFIAENVWVLIGALFLMGAHSTFFGPIKYALLPQHLHEGELVEGNAYIEAGTFLSILLGTILGGVLIVAPHGEAVVSLLLIAVAAAGYGASRFIPAAPAPEPGLQVSLNIVRETWRIIGFSRRNARVFRAILGISWFWLVGATFLSQFPAYVRDVLHGNEHIVTLFLTVFSLGIGIGSFVSNKLLGGAVSARFVPWAGLFLSVFTADLYLASDGFAERSTVLTAGILLQTMPGVRILFDLLMIAVAAGVFIVPLYAIMQHESAVEHRARIIAANNVMNALFMVMSALAVLAMLRASFTTPQIFLCMALVNTCVALYIRKLVKARIQSEPGS